MEVHWLKFHLHGNIYLIIHLYNKHTKTPLPITPLGPLIIIMFTV